MLKLPPSFQLESNILTKCEVAMADLYTHVWNELSDCIYKERKAIMFTQIPLRYFRP